MNGPFPTRKYSDITIFRDSLTIFLGPGERVEADDGYIEGDSHNVKCSMSVINPREMMKIHGMLRSRHETINRQFKEWGVLKQVFRHYASDHGNILYAIVVLTQMVIDSGETLFTCEYRDILFLYFFIVFVYHFYFPSLSIMFVSSSDQSFDGPL